MTYELPSFANLRPPPELGIEVDRGLIKAIAAATLLPKSLQRAQRVVIAEPQMLDDIQRCIDRFLQTMPSWTRPREPVQNNGSRRSADSAAPPSLQTPLPLSELLRIGEVYSRDELRRLLGITDATINNGVFRPANTSSVMPFVTEHKTSDRKQYRDRLADNLLHWQGQSSGRTNHLIIERQARSLELLVFFRKEK